MGKNNGSRYTQVKSSSSSPYHRPNKSSHPRDDHPPMGPTCQMSNIREFHRYSSECEDEDECCHLECCQGLKNVKETGCDPGKIDKNSRVFFPITFIMLCILYWTYYQIITDVTLEELQQEDIKRLAGQ